MRIEFRSGGGDAFPGKKRHAHVHNYNAQQTQRAHDAADTAQQAQHSRDSAADTAQPTHTHTHTHTFTFCCDFRVKLLWYRAHAGAAVKG